MKGDWHEKFKTDGKLQLSREGYISTDAAVSEDLPIYMNHLRENDRILECCCGPGYTAIPLSHHFEITAFDKDEKILEAAKENAKQFGDKISFRKLDFFDILHEFGLDSFHAVSSGGVLEHFNKKDIFTLLDLQLEVAPVVFAQMPLAKEAKEKKLEMGHGIERYNYTKWDWIDDIFSHYNLLEHRVLEPAPEKMRFRELMVVIGR